jgi:hypothetical protein
MIPLEPMVVDLLVPSKEGRIPARIIHERFCCTRRSASTTSLRPAGSPLRTLYVLHEYASGPHGSAR